MKSYYEGMKETAKELIKETEDLFNKIDDLIEDIPEENKKDFLENNNK